MTFRVGQRVRCIRKGAMGWLTEGKVYRVIQSAYCSDMVRIIDDEKCSGTYLHDRFVLARKYANEEEVSDEE